MSELNFSAKLQVIDEFLAWCSSQELELCKFNEENDDYDCVPLSCDELARKFMCGVPLTNAQDRQPNFFNKIIGKK